MNTEDLIDRAMEAKNKSYCPYSQFAVGAALLTGNGNVYTGTNIENSVNSLSICAERVALFKAISEGEREFQKLAVVCEGKYCRPCGACRQTLYEHAPNLTVIMANTSRDYQIVSLSELLPRAFRLESDV